ncbi:Signal peptidase I (LepB) [Eupransor demetentiae]|uniref:Signal peptidase I n=2 Tax=Eupransor demetentiae TaxID=3109584 RepID=A0ABP0ERB0_9LACO|nr:Signal peptidase I (LepB) [Lactobacillaceae bacterium LMG 33000]
MQAVTNFFKGWWAQILFFVVLVLIYLFVFSGIKISGTSMEPTLLDKQYVGINHVAKLKRGDVVVFDARKEDPRIQAGKKDYVKRIIGVPGDTVSFSNGNLYVNGKKVNQDYLSKSERTDGTAGDFGSHWDLKSLSNTGLWKSEDANTTKVPANSYFVMGDHRSVSNDGRYYGYISRKHITGKVVVPFWYSSTVKKYVDQQDKDFFAN